jgi:hypothetical protein
MSQFETLFQQLDENLYPSNHKSEFKDMYNHGIFHALRVISLNSRVYKIGSLERQALNRCYVEIQNMLED